MNLSSAVAALGGKLTLGEPRGRADESDDKIAQPQDAECKDNKGCLPLWLAAICHLGCAITGQV